MSTLIPNSRARLVIREVEYLTALQALIDGRWRTVSLLSSTKSSDFAQAEAMGRQEAAAIGVPWVEALQDRARQQGADSVSDREAENPYNTEREAALAEAWSEGREDAEQYAADEFADFCDPSMRDLYE